MRWLLQVLSGILFFLFYKTKLHLFSRAYFQVLTKEIITYLLYLHTHYIPDKLLFAWGLYIFLVSKICFSFIFVNKEHYYVYGWYLCIEYYVNKADSVMNNVKIRFSFTFVEWYTGRVVTVGTYRQKTNILERLLYKFSVRLPPRRVANRVFLPKCVE